MKHTPGPWSIAHNNIIGPESDGEYKGAHEVIARLNDSIYCKDNQRLILAAPCLLQALQEIIKGVPDTWPAVEKAKAAIRKATGND